MRTRSRDLRGIAAIGQIYGPTPFRSSIRNALVACLLMVSGLATWWGMNGFVLGVQGISDDTMPISIYGYSIPATYLIVAAVVVLTLLMWEVLAECLRPRRWFTLTIAVPVYAFLFLWSVGFGYGFWWSIVAGKASTEANFQLIVNNIKIQAETIIQDMDLVRAPVSDVAQNTFEKARIEDNLGGTCGVLSDPGQGPLHSTRFALCDSLLTLNNNIQKRWIEPIAADLNVMERAVVTVIGSDQASLDFLNSRAALPDRLGSELHCPKSPHARSAPVASPSVRNSARTTIGDPDLPTDSLENEKPESMELIERHDRFLFVNRELQRLAERINSRNRVQGQLVAAELRQWADRLSIKPGSPGFVCSDPELTVMLRNAADQASSYRAQLVVPRLPFGEGPEGVSVAILKLWNFVQDLISYPWKLLLRMDNGDVSDDTMLAGENHLSGRGIVALIATIGIDLGILILAIFKRADFRSPVRGFQWIDRRARPIRQRRQALQDIIFDALTGASMMDFEILQGSLGFHEGKRLFILPSIKSSNAEEGPRAVALNNLAGAIGELGGLENITEVSDEITALCRAQLVLVGWSKEAAKDPVILEIKRLGEFGAFLAEFSSFFDLQMQAAIGRRESAIDEDGKKVGPVGQPEASEKAATTGSRGRMNGGQMSSDLASNDDLNESVLRPNRNGEMDGVTPTGSNEGRRHNRKNFLRIFDSDKPSPRPETLRPPEGRGATDTPKKPNDISKERDTTEAGKPISQAPSTNNNGSLKK